MSGPILFLPENCSPPWNVTGVKVPVQLCWYIVVRLMSLGQNFIVCIWSHCYLQLLEGDCIKEGVGLFSQVMS